MLVAFTCIPRMFPRSCPITEKTKGLTDQLESPVSSELTWIPDTLISREGYSFFSSKSRTSYAGCLGSV